MLRFTRLPDPPASFLRIAAALMAGCFAILNAAPAAQAEISRCIALAEAPTRPGAPIIVPVAFPEKTHAFRLAAAADEKVTIHYLTHATFRITTPTGIVVVTDYAGFYGGGRAPDVATMNHAHETHYTDFPDPAISHVLRGWNPEGGPAKHELRVGDVFIRNVPTDIRRWGGTVREADGNSIFIFEVAGLCIGHLGHLHHELAPEDLARIGQLDVVLAPVDGSFTMDQESMVKTLKVLKARVIIPMHAFGPQTLAAFVERMGNDFDVEYRDNAILRLGTDDLPDEPTIVVLPEASTAGWSWD